MNDRNLQHPDITRLEKYGMPEDPPIYCPFCGEECEKFYKRDGEVIGCDMCIDIVDAYTEETEY